MANKFRNGSSLDILHIQSCNRHILTLLLSIYTGQYKYTDYYTNQISHVAHSDYMSYSCYSSHTRDLRTKRNHSLSGIPQCS